MQISLGARILILLVDGRLTALTQLVQAFIIWGNDEAIATLHDIQRLVGLEKKTGYFSYQAIFHEPDPGSAKSVVRLYLQYATKLSEFPAVGAWISTRLGDPNEGIQIGLVGNSTPAL